MSQFENSEIMQEYAKIMHPVEKTATTSGDWFEALVGGIAGEAALIGAAKATLALGATGKAAAVAGALIPTGPLGWATAGLLLGATAIWAATRMADDNLEDLISRFEDLSTDSEAAQEQINKVISRLKSYKSALGVQEVPESPEQRVQQAKNKLDTLTDLTKYLVLLKPWFSSELKPELTDWSYGGIISGDAEEAEAAVSKTLDALLEIKERAAQNVKTKSKEAIQEYSKTLNKDLAQLGRKVKSMYDELTKRFGGPPKFTNRAEKRGFELAESLASQSATLEDVKENAQNLIMLHGVFEKALDIPQKQAIKNSDGITRHALELGDGTQVSIRDISELSGDGGGRSPEKSGPGKKLRYARGASVRNIQGLLNRLHKQYRTGHPPIATDAVYGPQTAQSIQVLLEKQPQLTAQSGIQTVDFRQVAKNPSLLQSINSFVSRLSSGGGVATTEQKTPQTNIQHGGGQYNVLENPNKWNPNAAEILAALNNERIDGYPALKWLENRGYSRERAVDVVRKVHRTSRGTPPSGEWSMSAIKNYVQKNPSGRNTLL